MTSGKTFVPSCERLVTKVAEDLICWGKEGRRGVKTQISGNIEVGTLSQSVVNAEHLSLKLTVKPELGLD